MANIWLVDQYGDGKFELEEEEEIEAHKVVVNNRAKTVSQSDRDGCNLRVNNCWSQSVVSQQVFSPLVHVPLASY